MANASDRRAFIERSRAALAAFQKQTAALGVSVPLAVPLPPSLRDDDCHATAPGAMVVTVGSFLGSGGGEARSRGAPPEVRWVAPVPRLGRRVPSASGVSLASDSPADSARGDRGGSDDGEERDADTSDGTDAVEWQDELRHGRLETVVEMPGFESESPLKSSRVSRASPTIDGWASPTSDVERDPETPSVDFAPRHREPKTIDPEAPTPDPLVATRMDQWRRRRDEWRRRLSTIEAEHEKLVLRFPHLASDPFGSRAKEAAGLGDASVAWPRPELPIAKDSE